MILNQIDEKILHLAEQSEQDLKSVYEKLDRTCLVNSDRILSAFTAYHERHKRSLSDLFRFAETRRHDDFPDRNPL